MVDSAIFIFLVLGGFTVTAVATFFYLRLAKRFGIVAIPNTRSSHKHKTALGGGIVFATVFLTGLAVLFAQGHVPVLAFAAIAGGGAVISAVGFMDDVVHVSARLRFALHVILCVFLLACLGGLPPVRAGGLEIDLGWAGHILAAVALVWFINLYNFMDGIDGMAASGGVFAAAAAAALMLLWSGPVTEASIAALLAACAAGFLPYNWPPARLFMGDSGSTFLGYVFGALILMTMASQTLSAWTWLILLGCFIADTCTTLLLRMWMIRRWYAVAHRSHAYQNLARVVDSHLLVTGGALLISLFWLLPLAVWSMYAPGIAPLIAALALLPLVVISLKYGPLFSSA